MKRRHVTIFVEIILLMVFLQSALALIKWLFDPLTNNHLFYTKMATMCAMILLTFLVLLYAKIRNQSLSVFPKVFTKRYIFVTCISALLFLSTPSIYVRGIPALLVLIYGSIVTPIYEELLFRGYIWNRIGSVIKNESVVWLVDALLFSLWHLGYVFPNVLRGDLFAVSTKLVIGFGYGILLGFVRLKAKNCYSTMLLHGVLNIFL